MRYSVLLKPMDYTHKKENKNCVETQLFAL